MNLEDRLQRGDQAEMWLASPIGKLFLAHLDQREKDIVDAMLGEPCRQARAYEVFSGRANEIRDLKQKLKHWVDDGAKAKQLIMKGAAGA